MAVRTKDVTGGSSKTEESIGSRTAKDGFQNEDVIVERFINWKTDSVATEWLVAMGYKTTEIKEVEAVKVRGSYKTDVQVKVLATSQGVDEWDIQNIQVKLVSQSRGYNQIDKRWVKAYVDMWDIPDEISRLLRLFNGELKPIRMGTKNPKRMFVNEFSKIEQVRLLDFLKRNKMLILLDIVKGRGKFSVEWVLVIMKSEGKWALVPINKALAKLDGEVAVTTKGSIKIGRVTMQRKGGDNGRDSANMLQFKVDPTHMFRSI